MAEVRAWEELSDLELSDAEFVSLLQASGVDTSKPVKTRVSTDQFITFVRSLDETEEAVEPLGSGGGSDVAVSESQQDKEILAALSQMESTSDGEDVLDMSDLDMEGEEVSEEENREFMEGIFLTLGKDSKSKTIKVSEFMAWDELKDMMSDGLLDTETVQALLAEVGVDGSDKSAIMDFESFYNAVTMLDETLEAMDGIDVEDGVEEEAETAMPSTTTAVSGTPTSGGADLGEDEEMDAFAKEIFTELSAGKPQLNIDAFKKWEQVSELLGDSLVAENTVDVIITEICEGRGKFSFSLSFPSCSHCYCRCSLLLSLIITPPPSLHMLIH